MLADAGLDTIRFSIRVCRKLTAMRQIQIHEPSRPLMHITHTSIPNAPISPMSRSANWNHLRMVTFFFVLGDMGLCVTFCWPTIM